MADKKKIAELHGAGFNCAQVTAYMCRDLSKLDENTALAAMGGFGGGVRCGEVCGVISGGVYTLGLCNPYTDTTDKEAKDKIAALTKRFTAKFKEEYDTMQCRELLITSGGHGRCEEFMDRAVDIIHQILEEEGKQ